MKDLIKASLVLIILGLSTFAKASEGLNRTKWKLLCVGCSDGQFRTSTTSETTLGFSDQQYLTSFTDKSSGSTVRMSGSYKLLDNKIILSGFRWAYPDRVISIKTPLVQSSYIEMSQGLSHIYIMSPGNAEFCDGKYKTDAYIRVK